jgi:hypothetical protein
MAVATRQIVKPILKRVVRVTAIVTSEGKIAEANQ